MTKPRQCKICHRYEAMLTKGERVNLLQDALDAIVDGKVPRNWATNDNDYFAKNKRAENWPFILGYLEATIHRLVTDDNGLCLFCGRSSPP